MLPKTITMRLFSIITFAFRTDLYILLLVSTFANSCVLLLRRAMSCVRLQLRVERIVECCAP